MMDVKATKAAQEFAESLREMSPDDRVEAIRAAVRIAGICRECGGEDPDQH